MAAHRPQEGETVHFGHVVVRDDQVERLDRRLVQGVLAVFRLVDIADAQLLQRHAGHLPNAELVIDNEHFESCCCWHLVHSFGFNGYCSAAGLLRFRC